jgi:hypothetical protein
VDFRPAAGNSIVKLKSEWYGCSGLSPYREWDLHHLFPIFRAGDWSASMKTLKMKLGNGYVDVSVPEENLLGIIQKEVPASAPEEEVIQEALAHPIGTPRLQEIVKPGETVCIVVSDITRAYQRLWVYLPFIVEELNDAGITDEDIRFLSAIGYHRAHTAEEHAKMLGPELNRRFKMVDHDCLDKGSLINLGVTSRGTPITIKDGPTPIASSWLLPPWWLGGGKKSSCRDCRV